MKKIIFFLQLTVLLVFTSCHGDDPVPDPTPQPPAEAENTIFVYMPWSGDSGNLYSFFLNNLADIRQAVQAQGGLDGRHLVVFISQTPSKGALINIEYRQGRCVDDTVAVFDNTRPGLQPNSASWITTLLKRVQEYAPARSYSMIVGCHGLGWLPGNYGVQSRHVRSVSGKHETERLPLTRNLRSTMKYNADKCKLLREGERIIIDEISMVRADIIDFIDKVLRIYNRNMREPFGGKQLLLVGDIYQLEPVLKEEDRQLLQPYYASSYFFDAKVFQDYPLVSIELNKVYRQNDPSFISILDHIRTNQVSDNDLRYINARVGAQRGTTEIPQEDFTITLSTRRDTVDWINNQGLDSLNGAPVMFLGEIKGEFPESSLPTDRTEHQGRSTRHVHQKRYTETVGKRNTWTHHRH